MTNTQARILTQISCDKGSMKLNTPGVCFTGFLIIIEMPNDMNGLLKSMTRSRSAVMVMAAIAISASCVAAHHTQAINITTPPT